MRTSRLALLLALPVAATFALARPAGMPMPKAMSGLPAGAGAWRIELLEGAPAAAGQAAGAMTVCQTAAEALGSKSQRIGNEERCTARLVEDTSAQAVIETRCPDGAMRTTLLRTGPNSFTVGTRNLSRPSEPEVKARMTYAGACSARDPVVQLDKSSPACRDAQTQLAQLDAARTQCASAGAQRAQCEQMLAQSRAMLEGMCR
jgi:hypothetical protein